MEGKINLDQLCAEYGYKFAEEVSRADDFNAKKAEVLITKALGVLQEQGLYAFVLFCESRTSAEKSGAEKIEASAKELLRKGLFLPTRQYPEGRFWDLMLSITLASILELEVRS